MGILKEVMMSFLLNNQETLTDLFKTFNLQEILVVNQNLRQSWHLLSLPPEQLLIAMEKQEVAIDTFLGKKCLPLIRFYLASEEDQKSLFLSIDLLGLLFISLPPVEAAIFKQQIQRAQAAVQKTNQAISLLLENDGVCDHFERADPVIQLNQYQTTKNQQSNKEDEVKQYLNLFYYLQAGELFVMVEGKTIDNDLLLYSELSPLQQLHAQKLVAGLDENDEPEKQLVVSA